MTMSINIRFLTSAIIFAVTSNTTSNMFITNVFEHKSKQQSTQCLFLDKMYQMVTHCTQIMLYIIFLVQDTNFNS